MDWRWRKCLTVTQFVSEKRGMDLNTGETGSGGRIEVSNVSSACLPVIRETEWIVHASVGVE